MPRDTLSTGWDGPISVHIGNSLGDWLLWLGLLLLAGAIILGRMLNGMGNLVYDSRSVDKETGKPIRSGAALDQLQPVGLIRFTLLRATQFRGQVSRLAPRSVLLLNKWLSFDYGFMRLAYPALALIGWWLIEHPDIYSLRHWHSYWRWVVIVVPMLAWIADVIENQSSLRAIRETSAGLASNDPPVRAAALDRGDRWVGTMRVASILKWILVTLAIAMIIALAIVALVRYPAEG